MELFGTWIEEAAYEFHAIGRYIDGLISSGIVLFSFWKDAGDRFFLFFAVSFLIECVNRAALRFSDDANEGLPFFHFVRSLSFFQF